MPADASSHGWLPPPGTGCRARCRSTLVMQTSRLTLVFDGDCAFCTACATLLRWLDRNHRVHVAPFQAPGVCQSLGLPFEECEKAAWALGGDGRLAPGAAALLPPPRVGPPAGAPA